MIDKDTDMLFICNPNNPTGVLCDRDYLGKVSDRCRECGTYMILDECFIDLIDDPDAYTMKAYLEKNYRLVILKAFTKLYAMPGLRLGYGLCRNTGLMERIKEVSQPWSVSLPAQMAGVAALKEKEYVRTSKEEILRQKKRLVTELEAMGYKIYGYGANYIFFKADDDFSRKCLEMGIMIRDCSNYEGLQKGFYRIAVRSAEDNDILLKVFRELKEGL